MATSTWISTAGGSISNVAGNQAAQGLTIPANARLVRVVWFGTLGGVQTQDGVSDPNIGGAYHKQTLFLKRTGFADEEIYHAEVAIPFEATAIDDHLLLTKNRVYKAYHHAGSQDIGFNLQMSWGGPGKPSMSLLLTHGNFHHVDGTKDWISSYTQELRALYFT